MKDRFRNDQTMYLGDPDRWWGGADRGIRMLANQASMRMVYFDTIDHDWTGKETLDLGCGGGIMAETLARRGARVTGVDPAAAALGAARDHARISGLEINYLPGDGEGIPLADASMDRVVCVDVLEHIPAWRAVIGEIRRVLRPGGVFFFDTVNRTILARLVTVTMAEGVLGLVPRGTHDPALFIKPRELREELLARGFVVPPIRGMGPVGISRKRGVVFGLVPFKAVMYIGHAIKGG